jgi:hypothetical protein
MRKLLAAAASIFTAVLINSEQPVLTKIKNAETAAGNVAVILMET